MAFRLAQLFVDIAARTTGVDRALTGLKSQLSGLGGLIAGLGPALGISLAAGGAVAALTAVVKTTTSLETAFVKLAKATDLDPEGMRALKAEMEGVARSIRGVSYANLLEIATTGAKMGIAAEDLVDYAEGVAKVSTAMDDLPADVVAEQIGKLNTVFRLGVEGTMQLGSAIDRVADSGVSSASGILAVAQRISGTAVAAKMTAQETIALAGALLDTGTQAELAASTVQRLVMNFAKAPNPMKEMVGWLNKLRTMNFEDQLATINALEFGRDSPVGAGEIMKLAKQADTLQKYVGMANEQFKTLNQINKSYNATAKKTDAMWQQTKNHLAILMDRLGQGLLPVINTTLGLVNDLATGLSDAFANVTPILADIMSGLGDWTPVLEGIGFGFRHMADFVKLGVMKISQDVINLVERFSVIPANLKVVGEWVRDNWATMMIDGVKNVITAFQNLGTNVGKLFEAIWNAAWTGEFKVNWTPLTEGFKSAIGELPKLVDPKLTDMSASMKELVDKINADEAGHERKKKARGDKAAEDIMAGAGEGAATKEFKSTTMAADEFARHLQKAIFDDDGKKVAEETRDNTKAISEGVKEFNLRLARGLLIGMS